MIKKVYEKIKEYIYQNYKFLILIVLSYFILTFPLPYYIRTAGGLINISDRVIVENGYKKKGSFNLSYVTEIKGNCLTYLLSYVIPDWDLVDESENVASNETVSDADYRNRILLDEANANALFVAYTSASKKINITDKKYYVIYIDNKATTNFKVGDQILEIENQEVKSIDDYRNIVNNKNIGDTLNIRVKDRNKNITIRNAKVYEDDNTKLTGIVIATKYSYKEDPKVKFEFKNNETGPSGGLMMAIAIYDKLVSNDLTKGRTIVGTGTIDIDGNVGEISGIKYKIEGAVKAKADVFLTPLGDNYEEALELVKENNYDIKIVGIANFNDAIKYLRGESND